MNRLLRIRPMYRSSAAASSKSDAIGPASAQDNVEGTRTATTVIITML